MRSHLFSTDKINYVKGKKPDVKCILCAIRDRHPEVESLEVDRTDKFIIALNLYPFNTGQLMIFPLRHIEDISDFTDEESLEMHKLLVKSISILRDEFKPAGFNIGYNLGENSGASISHVHQHIVPRYSNELGYFDVLAETRSIVTDPREVLKRLRSRFKNTQL